MKMQHLVLASLAVAALAAWAHGWPSVFPTGTTLYQPDKAFNGYTLFTPLGGDDAAEPYEKPSTMYLIDMNGNVVHTWTLPFRSEHGVLLPSGNLLVACNDAKEIPGRPSRKPYTLGGGTGWIYELDWDGNIVFQHFDPNMHHDFDRLPNGNTIYVAWEELPEGRRSKVRGGIKGSEFEDGLMWSDTFVEINPQGELVWESNAGAARSGRRHFSSFIGGAERLPNGNTLICAGANGRLFEVTEEYDIVWEYINPYVGGASLYGAVFRAHR